MIYSLISDDGIQRFDFLTDKCDPEVTFERHALVARAPGKAKHVASWRKTGESVVTKRHARQLWRDLVSRGATRHDHHGHWLG